VKIDLIVRDTCRLRPGIAGLSESVRVVSVVGRFLEHGRIYYFRNGGAEEYFIGSADCMKRNLESRVEVVAPVEDPQLRKELRTVLDIQLRPNRCQWEMMSDGTYTRTAAADARARVSAGDDRFRGDSADRSNQGQEAPERLRPPGRTRTRRVRSPQAPDRFFRRSINPDPTFSPVNR
jgi:polyphosphate kinase